MQLHSTYCLGVMFCSCSFRKFGNYSFYAAAVLEFFGNRFAITYLGVYLSIFPSPAHNILPSRHLRMLSLRNHVLEITKDSEV